MPQQLVIPKFASEAEEAQWWFDNQDLVFEEFKLAAKEGRLGRGTLARRARAGAAAKAVEGAPDSSEASVKHDGAKVGHT